MVETAFQFHASEPVLPGSPLAAMRDYLSALLSRRDLDALVSGAVADVLGVGTGADEWIADRGQASAQWAADLAQLPELASVTVTDVVLRS